MLRLTTKGTRRLRYKLRTLTCHCGTRIGAFGTKSHHCKPSVPTELHWKERKEKLIEKAWANIPIGESTQMNVTDRDDDDVLPTVMEEKKIREPISSAHHIDEPASVIWTKQPAQTKNWPMGNVKMQMLEDWRDMRNISHKDVSLLLELLSRQELAKYPIFTAKEYDAIIRKQPNLWAESKVFNDPDLQFYWLPLPDVLAQLLADASLVEELQFNYQEITKDGQKAWGHWTTCRWMQQAVQLATSIEALPFPFIIGADATNIVTWGIRMFHPVYIWCPLYTGSQPSKSFRCIGLIPLLSSNTFSADKAAHHRAVIWHKCIELLLAPIKLAQKEGLTLFDAKSKSKRKYMPLLCQFLSDIPEKMIATAVLSGNCWKCLIPQETLLNMKKLFKKRKPHFERVEKWLNMVKYGTRSEAALAKKTAHATKERILQSAFSGLLGFDVYRDTTTDIMHQMDLGIGPYLFDALVLAYDPSCPLISKNSQKKEQQTHTQKKDGKRPIKRMRREDNEEQECEKEKENDDTEQREEEENDHDERREGHDEVSEPQEEEETLAPRRRKVRKKNQGMRALSLSEKLNYRYSKIHKFSCGNRKTFPNGLSSVTWLDADSIQAIVEDAPAVFAGIEGKSLGEDLGVACLVLYNMLYTQMRKPVVNQDDLDHLKDLNKRLVATINLAYPNAMDKVVKLHLLRHQVKTCKWHGTMVSTRTLEHQHLTVKNAFRATNMQKSDSTAEKQVLTKLARPQHMLYIANRIANGDEYNESMKEEARYLLEYHTVLDPPPPQVTRDSLAVASGIMTRASYVGKLKDAAQRSAIKALAGLREEDTLQLFHSVTPAAHGEARCLSGDAVQLMIGEEIIYARLGIIFKEQGLFKPEQLLYYPLRPKYDQGLNCPYLGLPVVVDNAESREWMLGPVTAVMKRVRLVPLLGRGTEAEDTFLVSGKIEQSLYLSPTRTQQRIPPEKRARPTQTATRKSTRTGMMTSEFAEWRYGDYWQNPDSENEGKENALKRKRKQNI